MTTETYALKVTLVDTAGAPIIRCWGPCFDIVDGVPSSPGWHHFIISFDASVPRVQMAMDRDGGPVLGGGVLDTQLGTGEIDGTGSFPNTPASPVSGNAPQQMFAELKATSLNGFAPTPGTLSEQGDWEFDADLSTPTDFAYCYYGVPSAFFDLTESGNLDYFISGALTPVNFGMAGGNIPMTCLFMHTGNASVLFADFKANPYSATVIYTIGDTVFFNGSNYTSLIVNNLNNQPNISPTAWLLLNSVLQFQYNAATGRLWGGTIGDAPTQPPTGA